MKVRNSGFTILAAVACGASLLLYSSISMGGPVDTDGDGILDSADNCALTPNGPLGGPSPSQCDSDGDGMGNVCDQDVNGDGTVTIIDLTGAAGAITNYNGVGGPCVTGGNTLPMNADFNQDGTVTIIDLTGANGAITHYNSICVPPAGCQP